MKFKKGMKVKVVKNLHGHASPVGETFVLPSWNANGDPNYFGGYTQWKGYTIYADELAVAAATPEDMKKQIAEHEAEIADLRARLSYLAEVGSDVFDEDEFRVYKALEVVDSSKSKIEKARAIAALVRS